MATILQVVEAFGGGVFASVSQICNQLAMRGHDVHLCYSERPQMPKPLSDYIDKRVNLYHVPMARSINLKIDILTSFKIKRLISSLNPDVIHLQSSKAGALGRVAALMCNQMDKVFYSPRGLSFLQEDESKIKRRLYHFFEWLGCRIGGTVLACSSSEYSAIQQSLYPKKLKLIENAVDTAIIPRKMYNKASNHTLVGTLGRVGAQKNPSAFLQIVKNLRNTNAKFLWIGGGDPKETKLLKEQDVEVTGWLTRTEALKKLSELDVYVQTSLWEGMPIAVIEAQVSGIATVVTDVVGNRDVVDHNVTGFIADNLNSFEQYVERLVKNPELRECIGKNAHIQAAKRFSLDRLMDELIEFYSQNMKLQVIS